ncbi:MAG TPA: hypothetical protein PL005_03745 [Candidatus Hydrogenedentes bacterium]|nr:hypothetical protein [Candidatus Hydrogenedentota bacterium]
MTRTASRTCGDPGPVRPLTPFSRPLFTGAVFLLLCAACAAAGAGEWTGSLSGESRVFLDDPRDGDQSGHTNLSLSGTATWVHEWPDSGQSLVFTPFGRLDQHDNWRTHADVRELYWQKAAPRWELRLGLRKVHWGVAESQRLVDVINQRDTIEALTGDEKLGQPMANFAWINSWGTLDLFWLPYFRERTLTGRHGRFRTPVPMHHEPLYESGAEEWNQDFAVRYAHYIGSWDFGLTHFHGNSRDPRYVPEIGPIRLTPDSPYSSWSGANINSRLTRLFLSLPFARLIPYYDQIDQTGLDVQYTTGNWIWKAESIYRTGMNKDYGAVCAGFEYTFGGVFGTDADLGTLLEYNWDSRGKEALTNFQNDVFLGGRLALNDVQSTSLLGGVFVDLDSAALAFGLEGERRLGEDWKLSIEARIFSNVPADDLLTFVRKDDYIQATLTWYF